MAKPLAAHAEIALAFMCEVAVSIASIWQLFGLMVADLMSCRLPHAWRLLLTGVSPSLCLLFALYMSRFAIKWLSKARTVAHYANVCRRQRTS